MAQSTARPEVEILNKPFAALKLGGDLYTVGPTSDPE